MQIFIPTCGRATSSQQTTLAALNEADLEPVLVVQAKEAELYAHLPAVVRVLPEHITTIAPTRQYILAQWVVEPTFCMVDDDLVFFKRRNDDRTKLADIYPSELSAAFREMEVMLLSVSHVGFAAREGANRDTDKLRWNTRIMRVLGYNTKVLRDFRIRFDRLEVMEDFDVALQLLSKGSQNVILNEYANNQAGSGKSGGCSTFRTPELHARNAYKLAELHPGLVSVVDKTTSGAWGGGTRKDVRVQWKKALAGASDE